MNRLDAEYQKRTHVREAQIDRAFKPQPQHQETRLTPSYASRFDKACFNEELARSGPFYLRHFPIFPEGTPGPTMPDYTKDPRFGLPTKTPLMRYTSLDQWKNI